VVTEVKPFGLAGSAGSTPLRITVKGDPPRLLFGKLYAQSHLRSDRWYKLGRELLYGRLEDEKPFNGVRRLVQQEDYALALMQRAGLPSPTPFGFVELTPEREYLLVTEFFDGATELGEAEVDDQLIDDGLGIIRRLWEAGLAHRDIKPANLLVRDGRLLLIDVAFVEARPTPWRQAVDLANMMLCLALRCGPERVYRRALQFFTIEEISEGFAAARGLALPSQLRHLLRTQGRDLHAEFVRLLPSPPRPIRVQRWSARRVGLWAAILALVVLAALNPEYVFTNKDAVETPLGVSDVGCSDLEPLWLMAQSVPSASMVPCVRFLPVGWSVEDVAVNDGRSVLALDHDRAGDRALVMRLAAACDPGGAVEGPSATGGVRHFQRIESSTGGEFRATWYDQFPGGCVTSRLRLTTDPNGEFAAQAPHVLGFATREGLRAALDQRSGGRLQLGGVLVDALDGDHAQVRRALAQLPGLLVALRPVPALGGREVLELQHDQAGRLPVALEDGQLAAADDEAAPGGRDRASRRGLVPLVPLRVGDVGLHDDVGGHGGNLRSWERRVHSG
jgi:hypothetical protein